MRYEVCFGKSTTLWAIYDAVKHAGSYKDDCNSCHTYLCVNLSIKQKTFRCARLVGNGSEKYEIYLTRQVSLEHAFIVVAWSDH